jgi:hypothetical protein
MERSSFLVIPGPPRAKAGIQLFSMPLFPRKRESILIFRWFSSAELRLACGEPVTFWHCPKSNQKG